MKIHLPNSAFLGNIDFFLSNFDNSSPDSLEITANPKWIAVHPVVLSMVAALGLTLKPEDIHCEEFTARSKHYIDRMGLFKTCKISSGISVVEHDPSGRFIPITQLRTSDESS